MEQKRLLMAALLSIMVLLGWGLLFPPQEPPPQPAPAPVAGGGAGAPAPTEARPPTAAAAASPTQPAAAPVEEQIAADREEEVVVETDAATLVFTNRGAQLLSFKLRDTFDRSGQPLEMVRLRQAGPYPFAFTDVAGDTVALNDALFAIEERPRSADVTNGALRFRYAGPGGSATKEFRFRPDGMFEVSATASGIGRWGLLQGPGLRNPTESELSSRFAIRAAAHSTSEEPEQFVVDRQTEAARVPATGVTWFGLEDTYFLAVIAPESAVFEVLVQPMLLTPGAEGAPPTYTPRPTEDRISEAQEDMVKELQLVLVPEGDEFSGVAYWGTKSYRTLAALPFELEKTIRWGLRIPVISVVLDPLVGFLARWMLFLLLWIHGNIIANYGWSIVLLTISIKLLLMPLTHKSYVSMQKMQRLQPKIESIKQKYRSKQRDKQGRPNLESQRKMNEEMQGLFKTEGVNPAAGCLPMLLQMPVFFSLFSLLRNTVELWGAPWQFWIHDLSAPDPYYALPVVMGAAQFLQQRMTPMANANPGQRILLTTMPIWLTVISFGFASGLVLYWLTNSLLTMAQQGTYQRLKRAGLFGGEPEPPEGKPAGKKKERAERDKKK